MPSWYFNDSCGAMQMVIKSLSLITTLESVSEVTWLMGCNLLYTVKMTRKYVNYFQYTYIIGMIFEKLHYLLQSGERKYKTPQHLSYFSLIRHKIVRAKKIFLFWPWGARVLKVWLFATLWHRNLFTIW